MTETVSVATFLEQLDLMQAAPVRYLKDWDYLRSLAVTLANERAQAEQERDALKEFFDACLCEECGGSGRTDNHVTGEVECGSCVGTGHDSRKAFAALTAAQQRIAQIQGERDLYWSRLGYEDQQLLTKEQEADQGATDPAIVKPVETHR